jgi:hypothetical protein
MINQFSLDPAIQSLDQQELQPKINQETRRIVSNNNHIATFWSRIGCK